MAERTRTSGGVNSATPARFRDPAWSQGFVQIPTLVVRDATLSPSARLLYAVLLSYAWGEGRCFPSQETLAADLGTTDRTVRRAQDELLVKGLISIERRGQGKTNIAWIERIDEVYRLDVDPNIVQMPRPTKRRSETGRLRGTGHQRPVKSGQQCPTEEEPSKKIQSPLPGEEGVSSTSPALESVRIPFPEPPVRIRKRDREGQDALFVVSTDVLSRFASEVEREVLLHTIRRWWHASEDTLIQRALHEALPITTGSRDLVAVVDHLLGLGVAGITPTALQDTRSS